MSSKPLKKAGIWTFVGGIIFASLPIGLAFLTALLSGKSMTNEGEGTGTYLWFLFVTVPIGFLVVIVGLVLFIVGLVSNRSQPHQHQPESRNSASNGSD